MLITMTDPGMKPLIQNVTTFDEVMSLLIRCNCTYVNALVGNDDGTIIMTARRDLGAREWKMKFHSDRVQDTRHHDVLVEMGADQ